MYNNISRWRSSALTFHPLLYHRRLLCYPCQAAKETLAAVRPGAAESLVVIDDNVNPVQFFRNVSWVASPSYLEGSHQAITEGMVAG